MSEFRLRTAQAHLESHSLLSKMVCDSYTESSTLLTKRDTVSEQSTVRAKPTSLACILQQAYCQKGKTHRLGLPLPNPKAHQELRHLVPLQKDRFCSPWELSFSLHWFCMQTGKTEMSRKNWYLFSPTQQRHSGSHPFPCPVIQLFSNSLLSVCSVTGQVCAKCHEEEDEHSSVSRGSETACWHAVNPP